VGPGEGVEQPDQRLNRDLASEVSVGGERAEGIVRDCPASGQSDPAELGPSAQRSLFSWTALLPRATSVRYWAAETSATSRKIFQMVGRSGGRPPAYKRPESQGFSSGTTGADGGARAHPMDDAVGRDAVGQDAEPELAVAGGDELGRRPVSCGLLARGRFARVGKEVRQRVICSRRARTRGGGANRHVSPSPEQPEARGYRQSDSEAEPDETRERDDEALIVREPAVS
jgi:hypothetical protein